MDEGTELTYRPALDTASDIATHERIQFHRVELREQALAGLQIREMQAKPVRIEVIQQRNDLFLGAAELQRIDNEQQAGG
jgi:hypothetical protein